MNLTDFYNVRNVVVTFKDVQSKFQMNDINELDLYKFIKENGLEMAWEGEVLNLRLQFPYTDAFMDLISDYAESEYSPIQTFLRRYDLCMDLVPVCDYYGIDPERICER